MTNRLNLWTDSNYKLKISTKGKGNVR